MSSRKKAKGGSVTDDMPSPSMLDGAALGATLDRIRVHCTTCDRPVATPREETTPRDEQNPAICYFNGGLACHKHEVDWRARCLAAEASKRIDDMLERRVAKANRIAADATSIARRALVEGLAECERLRNTTGLCRAVVAGGGVVCDLIYLGDEPPPLWCLGSPVDLGLQLAGERA